MLPVNSRLSNKFAINFYYSSTKRCLLSQVDHRHQPRCNRFTLANAANSDDPSRFPPLQLANVYFDQFPNYCRMIQDAKLRAKKSILIDHCGIEHINLKTEFKNVEHVYSIEKETKRGFSKLSLIEFKSEDDAESVAKQAIHSEGLLPVPLKVFRYRGELCDSPDNQDLPFPVENVRLSSRREMMPSMDSYTSFLNDNMMSLVALKLRFVTLVNLERILCAGLFEEYELMPFGSSVIDTGCDSGDLDLVLTRKEDHDQVIVNSLTNPKKLLTEKRSSKLLHLDKSLYSVARDQNGIKGTMRWFDHILREYMPLTDGHGVVSISHAKVPIIRFTSRVTLIDCDLSFNLGIYYRDSDILTTNYSGILMSQALYALCRNNNLFGAVVVYLKYFGKLTGITSKSPGQGFTNFQFFSLIMFYLQRITLTSRDQSSFDPQESEESSEHDKDLVVRIAKTNLHKPLIPSFKRLLESGMILDETLALNLSNDQLNQVVPKIIRGFLEYYSNFDFKNQSLNLYESRLERKMDNSALYVVNPLDRSRNICHNVNKKAIEHLVRQVRRASGDLRSHGEQNPLSLIGDLLVKQQEQSKKLGSLSVEDILYSDRVRIDSTAIAQDVCS